MEIIIAKAVASVAMCGVIGTAIYIKQKVHFVFGRYSLQQYSGKGDEINENHK